VNNDVLGLAESQLIDYLLQEDELHAKSPIFCFNEIALKKFTGTVLIRFQIIAA
jgi:hypothetical protein